MGALEMVEISAVTAGDILGFAWTAVHNCAVGALCCGGIALVTHGQRDIHCQDYDCFHSPGLFKSDEEKRFFFLN